MNQISVSLVRSICEEFCDCVLIDDQNLSLLVYVKNKQKNKIVGLYQVLHDMESDDISWEEEDDDIDLM